MKRKPELPPKTRILPLMGSQGPFADLINRARLNWRSQQIEEPSELFRWLRGDPNNAGLSDLLLASRCGDLQIVADELNRGAEVNAIGANGTTALIESLSGRHFEISDLLLRNNADVRPATSSGWTALHAIANCCSEELGSIIINRGGNIDAQTDLGLTPLMMAARRRFHRMVKFFLDHGANTAITDSNGATALSHAANGDQDECGGDPKSIKALVKAGADVNVQDNEGWTPLMSVSFYGDLKSVLLLLKRGADVNVCDSHGRTALSLVEFGQKQEVVKTLSSMGAEG